MSFFLFSSDNDSIYAPPYVDRINNTPSQSVNTVDTLFSAFPAFLYLNPELAGYLLAPLLRYQDSSAYSLDYAAKNIGAYFIPLHPQFNTNEELIKECKDLPILMRPPMASIQITSMA